jgi:hypothetical protein
VRTSHRRTLEAIFATPPPKTLDWRDLEVLFVGLGAEVIEGRGSRVRFVLNNVIGTFHRPHPSKEAKLYQILDAKNFLEAAGVKP